MWRFVIGIACGMGLMAVSSWAAIPKEDYPVIEDSVLFAYNTTENVRGEPQLRASLRVKDRWYKLAWVGSSNGEGGPIQRGETRSVIAKIVGEEAAK